MLGDFHPGLQIEDLPPVRRVAESLFFQWAAAPVTGTRPVHHDTVGIWAELQVLPGMTGLAAGRSAALGAQALGRRFPVAIARWRLAAIAAVQPQTPLQFPDPLLQRLHLGIQRQDQVSYLLRRRGAQGDDLFSARRRRGHVAGFPPGGTRVGRRYHGPRQLSSERFLCPLRQGA